MNWPNKETTWIITGFEPFGAFDFNPSPGAARACQAALALAGLDATSQTLPVTFDCARRWGSEHLTPNTFAVHFGLAGSRAHISLEQTARNVAGQTLDNDGAVASQDGALVTQGPAQLKTALELERMCEALEEVCRREELPEARITQDAGSYVCNAIYYHSLMNAAEHGGALFVHIPQSSTEQASAIGRAIAAALLSVVTPSPRQR